MAPVVKMMSHSGFVYEKNNFVALVEKDGTHEDYHKMMDFIQGCKLSYAMLESPTIYCEVVEEVWTTAEFNSTDMTITFTLKGKTYCINCVDVQSCFKLPENTTMEPHTDTDVVNMLNFIGYSLDTASLGNIKRKGLRKEWIFLSDAFIKVFSGKISNFDAITSALINMLYMLLSDKYYNFSNCVMVEIGTKLGNVVNRPKNIYYARFIMLLANYVSEGLVIENPNNKLNCSVQEKRVVRSHTHCRGGEYSVYYNQFKI